MVATRLCCDAEFSFADTVAVPIVALGWSFQEWAIHKYLLHGVEVGGCMIVLPARKHTRPCTVRAYVHYVGDAPAPPPFHECGPFCVVTRLPRFSQRKVHLRKRGGTSNVLRWRFLFCFLAECLSSNIWLRMHNTSLPAFALTVFPIFPLCFPPHPYPSFTNAS